MKGRNRVLPLALGFVITLAVLVLGGGTVLAEGDFAGGEGTEEEPWLIGTPEQLATVAEAVYSDDYFELIADINLADYLSEDGDGWNGGAGWQPIGKWYGYTSSDNAPFTGSFNGGGFTIRNLYINRDEMEGVGLFGYTEGAVIKNVRLENADITGEEYVGSLVGYNENGTINNCSTDHMEITGFCVVGGLIGSNRGGNIIDTNAAGSVTGEFCSVGGLVGSNDFGEIANSYAEAAVQGDYMVGGLVGGNSNGSIESCYATGTVSDIDVPNPESQGYFGGLVGRNHFDGEVTDCYSTGNVGGTYYVGGLAGENKRGGIITSSYATGDVTGTNRVGGLVGNNLHEDPAHYDNPVISNCYATGSVEGNQCIGGLVGENSIGVITQCYATGTVIGTNLVGGLVGSNDTSINSSYYDKETTGLESGDGEPKTTIQMRTPTTYTGWDFIDVWGINPADNNGYPFLRWQTEYEDAQFEGGTGEAGNPYQVATPWQLNNVRLYLDKHFILVEDINLFPYLSEEGGGWNGGAGWQPIGAYDEDEEDISIAFRGSFDGDGWKIIDLFINRGGEDYQGLFGCIGDGAVIENVKLEDVDITGEDCVGGLVGYTNGSDVSISNSYATGKVTGTGDNVGGLVGFNRGGIIGSYAAGEVTGGVIDEAWFAGGLVGENMGTITGSYAAGEVTGTFCVGGLVGYNNVGTVTASYATGKITGTDSYIGGLVGQNDGTITGSYYNQETTGQSDNGKGQPKTTEQMKQQDTFTGWDFNDTWEINVGTYPYLSWQTDHYDFAPPVFADVYPQADNVVHNALDLLVQVDESATAYFVVLGDGKEGPNAGQVRAGTDAADEPLAENLKGSIVLTAGIIDTIYITGLIPETDYDIYMTAGDSEGNLQPDVSMAKLDVSTTGLPFDCDPPVAGGEGAISISDVTHNSLVLSWVAATDDATEQENLQYKVVFSENNDIDTVAGAETNGQTVTGWTANLTNTKVSGLSPEATYYLNIIVMDEAGNRAVYNMTSQATESEPSGGGSGGGGRRSAPDYTAKVTGGGAPGTKISVDVNSRSGSALVSLGKLAEDVLGGEEILVITVPPVEGVDTYTLELPGTCLCSSSAGDILTFSTEIGSITIPGNMLTGTGLENQGDIGITIGEGDKSSLPDHVREAVGDRPIVQLTLTVEGDKENWSNPAAPVTVSIPYTPTQEELSDPEHIAVWYLDGEGNAVEVPNGRYDPVTGTVTFATTHFSRYAVVYVQKTFDDLDGVEWARQQIEVLASKGIVRGNTDSGYFPSVNITRADFLYSLVRTLGVDAAVEGNFDDIEGSAYYYKEIGIAKKLGITSGTGDNRFCPDESITRQDMITLTIRALDMLGKVKEQGSISSLDRFTDKSLIAGYALESIATAVKEGLIIGSGDRINPLGNTTRAEAAVFLYRIYNR